jgi:hypothetical protein
LYEYISDTIEVAGQPFSKTLIEINQNAINPLKHDISNPDNKNNYDEGYFVIDKDKKLLSSPTSTRSVGYYCEIVYKNENNDDYNTLESATYECNPLSFPKNYYYANSQILYANGEKWYCETEFGYYFYNEKYLPASKYTIDDEVVYDTLIDTINPINHGIYINSMVKDDTILIQYDGTYHIESDIPYCHVINNRICEPTSTDTDLSVGSYCYDEISNKLYLIDRKEESLDTANQYVYWCRTGSENDTTFYYDGVQLYRMDGLSIQSMENGYYVLNKEWKAFNSNTLEVPFKFIKCVDYSCEMMDQRFDLNSDVVINQAGKRNNILLEFFKEETEIKFVNVLHPGYYFLNSNSEITTDDENPILSNVFEKSKDGILTKLNKTSVHQINHDDSIYLNYAKIGTFIRNGKVYSSSLLKYDSERDLIVYDGVYNSDDNKITYKLLPGDKLYCLRSKMLETIDQGFYAIKNDKSFIGEEWTDLVINKEICYYDGEKCNHQELEKRIHQKYFINQANDKISILEYNVETNQGRVVKEDGYFFFFEEGYSVSSIDRRIGKAIKIVDGNEIDITSTDDFIGYFIYENMMIEHSNDGWEDAVALVDNVDVAKRNQCSSYEKDHIIDKDGLCYDNKMSICVVKNSIKDSSLNENNCIFSQNEKIRYYLKNGRLYCFNNKINIHMNKSGIYVINRARSAYQSKIESEAKSYSCINDECKLEKNFASQYYLNMANTNDERPIILKYQNTTKEWSKTINDGFYFFNENGYPVSENEKAAYFYLVKDNGNTIENIKEHNEKGIYVSQSDPNQEIVMVNNGTWTEAITIPKCQYSPTTKVAKSYMKMEKEDVCMDGKNIVLLKNTINNKSKNEWKYDAVASPNLNTVIYSYMDTLKKLVIVKYDVIHHIEVNGFVVIDNITHLPLDSSLPTLATAFTCIDDKCEKMSDAITNEFYINDISKAKPLVQYTGNNQWKVVDKEGYYFINKTVENDIEHDSSYQVIKVNGKGNEQKDITKSIPIGFYYNKANTKDIVIKSNGHYLMNEVVSSHLCTVVKSENENDILCKMEKSETNDIVYNIGDYCYEINEDKLYLLTESTSFEKDTARCITGSNTTLK